MGQAKKRGTLEQRISRSIANTESSKGATPTPAEITQLVALFNAGRQAELEFAARLLLARHPDSGVAWKALGLSLRAQGKEALIAMQKAAELLPVDAEAHSNLGMALHDRGQLNEAVTSYRRALEIKPDFAEAHNNLGYALKDLGQLDAALTNFRRALEIKPDFAEAYNNLGSALKDLRQLDVALTSYLRALEIKPDFAEAHYNLGITFAELGQLDAAVTSYRRALEIKPDYAEAHNNLGNALKDLGQLDNAATSLCRALEIKPDFAEAYYNLGLTFEELGHLGAAVASCRRALEIRPDYAEAHSNLGNALRGIGQLDDAVTSLRKALEIKPDFALARSNLLYGMAYCGTVSPLEYLSEAKQWERHCLPQLARESVQQRAFKRPPRTNRRLRVGYVSGDFCQHAVSYFVAPLFELRDRNRIELFAYPTLAKRDKITEKLEGLADHWHSLAGLSDEAARQRIKVDQIDVLIDLSGHSAHNRLGVFALRAAPVQAHYLGYFASTGLAAMDYWIGDTMLVPTSEDIHYSENIWRLPRVWVSYQGLNNAPSSNWHPRADGTIWLGSFNNLTKITPATVALWAKTLHALPEGRLLLKTKGLRDPTNKERIQAALAAHGIAAERLELHGNTADWESHMAFYDRLDIALDPIGGVGGGTTTCDTLWMGVPVITLAGSSMAQRMTASMLEAIGHPEWSTETESDYVEKVVALARDVELRRSLRFSQREKMRNSPLCDAPGLARSLEDAYEAMFDRWWQTQPTAGIIGQRVGVTADNPRNQEC
jgi:predicted O-linked N-acetylglucosamine transferase (SPINDLY family)